MSTLKVDNIVTPGKNAGQIIVPANNTIKAPGQILQIQYASAGPLAQTISSTTPVAVTGLSISFTPKSSTSNVIVCGTISTNAVYVSSFAIYTNGQPTVSTSGQTNSNEANMNLTTYIGTTSTEYMNTFSVYMQEATGNTNARTYAVYATSGWSGTPYSLIINNRNSADMAALSYFWVMEVQQ